MVEVTSRCAFSVDCCSNEYPNKSQILEAIDWNLWSERRWERSWTDTASTGIHWYRDGDLNEEGREVVLKRFGLLDWQDEYPLKKLQFMSPAALVRERRKKEKDHNLLECLVIISDSIDHRPAEAYQ